MTCKSKATALGALETASVVSSGTQRDAIVAVINWVRENLAPDFDAETKAHIQKIYDQTFYDAARKGLTLSA